MAEIVQSELNSTLRRIKTSLNKRYEKDADLYISYQDTIMIKKHLYAKEFESLTNMMSAGILSKTVIGRVVAKNLWLLKDLSTEDYKSLKTIINHCDPSTLSVLTKSIGDNSIEMDPMLKGAVIKMYYGKAPVEECLIYLDKDEDENIDNSVLRECFIRVVMTAPTVDKKLEYINTYFSKHTSLFNDNKILVGIEDNLSGDELLQYQNSIKSTAKEYFDDREEIPKSIENAVFSFYADLDKYRVSSELEDMCSEYCERTYINKDVAYPVCVFIRDYIRQLPKEKAKDGIECVMSLYDDASFGMQGIIRNKVFRYKGYSEETTEELNRQLEDNDIEIEEADTFGTITKAEEIMAFMQNNKYNGPKWPGFAVYACLYKIKKGQGGKVLVDFLKKYADPDADAPCTDYFEPMTMEDLLPEIFVAYAEKAYESEPALLGLVKFFHELIDGEHDNDTNWNVDDNKYFILDIGSQMVDVLVSRRIKPGGKNGAYYNYLYDYRREDCKRIFDI